MTERSMAPQEEAADTKMYRPAPDGGLEPSSSGSGDYRDRLRSRRWDAAPLENPEVEKTDPRIAVGALVLLAVVTFVIIVVGYGAGVWSLPA